MKRGDIEETIIGFLEEIVALPGMPLSHTILPQALAFPRILPSPPSILSPLILLSITCG